MVDVEGKKLLTVYLLHSLALEMSAIQVFHGDRMTTVAHLIGVDTLGNYCKSLGLTSDVS